MILTTIKELIADTIDKREDALIKSIMYNPANTQADLWKTECALASCRELEEMKLKLCRAFDEKEKELQKKE